jgi:hypothetical protein
MLYGYSDQSVFGQGGKAERTPPRERCGPSGARIMTPRGRGGGRGGGRRGGGDAPEEKLAGGDAASTPYRGGGRQDAAASSRERHVDPVKFGHAVPEPPSHHKRGRGQRRGQRRGRRMGRRKRRDGGAPPLATVASATDLLPWPVANHKYLQFSVSVTLHKLRIANNICDLLRVF